MSSSRIPDYIYHYTSNDVLVKILERKSLRLSTHNYLNDAMEGKQFYKLLEKHPSQPGIEKIEIIEQALSPFELFVACFSSECDSLSQWRAYAGNGEGVAIGFSTKAILSVIKGCQEALLYPVVYADNYSDLTKDQARLVDSIMISSGTPKRSGLQSFAKERWAIKSNAFSEEKEFRLIITLDLSAGVFQPSLSNISVEYFAVPSGVRESCFFRFGDFLGESFIDSITLGPKNLTDEAALKRYLYKLNMPHVKVLRSKVSCR